MNGQRSATSSVYHSHELIPNCLKHFSLKSHLIYKDATLLLQYDKANLKAYENVSDKSLIDALQD